MGRATYSIGVDLGTTYSAAAVAQGGTAEVVALGHRSTVVPSAVLVTEGGDVLVGMAAVRRGVTEPARLAREFKRRIGDSVPLIVGGAPWSAEALTAKLLGRMVDEVVALHGGPPERVVVTHPANWGPFKQERMTEVLRLAGSPAAATVVSTMTEPAAAAAWYAGEERVPPGQVVAVYDLGGGTFDAAVLRKGEAGFELLGTPAGVERLGGIDIDEAVMAHVRTTLGSRLDELPPDDPATVRGLARLRAECVEAKEALSSDTLVTIPVALPGLHTDVRLTRSELEAVSRPLLEGSVAALARAIESAGLGPGEVDRVLLVGGGSRMPLVARMISGAFGRPFFVDAQPKHAVCLGAALTAASLAEREPPGPGRAPASPAPPAPASPARPTPAAPVPPAPVAPVPPAPVAPVPPAVPGPVGERPPGPVPTELPPVREAERPAVRARFATRSAARALAGLAAVLVVVLVALVIRQGSGGAGAGAGDEPAVSTPDQTSGEDPAGDGDGGDGESEAASLTEPVSSASPGAAGDLAVAADSVWVAGDGDRSDDLVRYPRSLQGEPERVEVTSGWVEAVGVDDNRLWAAVAEPQEGDTLLATVGLKILDPTSGTVTGSSTIGASSGAAHLAVDGDTAWVVTAQPDGADLGPILHRAGVTDGGGVDTAEVVTLDAGLTVQDVAVWDDRVWISVTEVGDGSGPDTGRILAVDAASGERVADEDIVLPDGPAGPIEAGPDGLWAVDWRSGSAGGQRVVRIDPASQEVVAELAVTASALAVGESWVWVWRSPGLESGSLDEGLILVDRQNGRRIDQLELPGDLVSIPHLAPAGDALWFTHGGEVHRIDVDR